MAKLNKLEPIVKKVLENNEESRKDDFILIREVMRHFVDVSSSFDLVCTRHKQLKVPSFASIIRVRRKLQVKHPSLCDAAAVEIREEECGDFKRYALDLK